MLAVMWIIVKRATNNNGLESDENFGFTFVEKLKELGIVVTPGICLRTVASAQASDNWRAIKMRYLAISKGEPSKYSI